VSNTQCYLEYYLIFNLAYSRLICRHCIFGEIAGTGEYGGGQRIWDPEAESFLLHKELIFVFSQRYCGSTPF